MPNPFSNIPHTMKAHVLPVASEIAHGVIPGAAAGGAMYGLSRMGSGMENAILGKSDPEKDHSDALAAGISTGLPVGIMGFLGKRFANAGRRQAIADLLHNDPLQGVNPDVQEAIRQARKKSPNIRNMKAYLHPDVAKQRGLDPATAEEAFKFVNNPGNAARIDNTAREEQLNSIYREMRGIM